MTTSVGVKAAMGWQRRRAFVGSLGVALTTMCAVEGRAAHAPPMVETARRTATVLADGREPLASRPFIRMLEKPRWITHRVVPRESLPQIAARYQVPLASLRRWNELEEDEIEKDTELRIWTRRLVPPRRRIEYRVAPDDTWWSIAVRHGVDSNDLRAYNWRAGRELVPGETIQIWIDPIIYGVLRRTGGRRSDIVRLGGVSVGSANNGRIINAVQIPERPEYTLMRPSSAYGTSHAVSSFVQALIDFRQRTDYEGRVVVRTMSRPRGGQLGSHLSHQSGRDVDINLPLKASVPQSLRPFPPSRIDWEATYHLVRSLAATGETVCIFLDYRLQRRLAKAAKSLGASPEELARMIQWPRGSGSGVGLVRHSPGHDDHLHVRFTCGSYEPECVERLDGPEGG